VQEGNELQGAASWIRVQIPLMIGFCVSYVYVVCWSFRALLCTMKKGYIFPFKVVGCIFCSFCPGLQGFLSDIYIAIWGFHM